MKNKKTKLSPCVEWFNKNYANSSPFLGYAPVAAGWSACKKKVLAILYKHDETDYIRSVCGEIEEL